MTNSEATYLEGYRPGVLGRISELHGAYYAKVWGSGVEFEGLVAVELREFLARYRPGRELLLTAAVGDRIVGSIAVDGSERDRPGARLRFVIVDEAFHGRGIGKQLLDRALTFCRQVGFHCVFLWTVEGLPQSFSLYERAGFQVVDRHPDERYGLPHVHLELEMSLD